MPGTCSPPNNYVRVLHLRKDKPLSITLPVGQRFLHFFGCVPTFTFIPRDLPCTSQRLVGIQEDSQITHFSQGFDRKCVQPLENDYIAGICQAFSSGCPASMIVFAF